MSKLNELKSHLKRGEVYRRSDLAKWSNAVDRHLKQLVENDELTKLNGGLYYYPKKSAFGNAPADDRLLVKAFLKDDRFLITSPNLYNALGVGTTQLYNKTIVYNHKRHGTFKLGGRTFDFRQKPDLPRSLSTEFLLVDLMNNLDTLAENSSVVEERVREKAQSLDNSALTKAVRYYGKVGTKKFFAQMLPENGPVHG